MVSKSKGVGEAFGGSHILTSNRKKNIQENLLDVGPGGRIRAVLFVVTGGRIRAVLFVGVTGGRIRAVVFVVVTGGRMWGIRLGRVLGRQDGGEGKLEMVWQRARCSLE